MTTQPMIDLAKFTALNVGILCAGGGAAFLAHTILAFVLRSVSGRTHTTFDDVAIRRCATPTRWMMILAGIWLCLDLTSLPAGVTAFLRHLLAMALVILTAWLIIRALDVARIIFLSRYNTSVADNLHARAVHTQIKILERIAISAITVIAFGCVLMTFDGVRQLGVSLLASAGIAGIILGLAAQKTLGTLLAGLQLALAQPIRIQDVVIVEGEWGIIEDITLTFVVVRIWDLRRLIVPTSYFMEKPFQNWTRISADLLGTVFLYVDCSAPIEPIREELHRLLQANPQWDGKAWGLQVTNISERTAELRALVSARNASDAWDLRCIIREGLLAFIRNQEIAVWPRLRVEQFGEESFANAGDHAPSGGGRSSSASATA